MRLDELAHFLELARQHNVTRAAEALRMTQPALSRSLARIEGELGVNLFDREGRRLRLNRYGEILIPHAARMLSEFDDARARIDALKDPAAGVVSLAFVTSFGSWLVPALIESYQQLFPNVRFLLTGGPADDVVDAVRNGGADVGFISPRPTAEDIGWEELTQETLVLAVPAGHRDADRDTIGTAELERVGFVALRPEFGLRQITDRYLMGLGLTPRILMEATELSTLHALVAAGIGAAIIPADPRPARHTVQIPLTVPLTRPAGMVVSTIRSIAPAAEQFARFVREEHATSEMTGLHEAPARRR
ncbi:LysR family transcriptional regulator [Nocardiopsis mangrovi]|uniref:LysR family transcriptional regulator n=1 Tax=Nocardiopsis mangrovi TaxID=1179818 RepID=A0ABV9DT16_9ACTN